jgi:hypothetical protein
MIISGGVALAFLGIALADLWKFINLNVQVPALVSELNVKELSSSRFAIEAHYSYEVAETPYKGKTLLMGKTFPNRYIAEIHKEALEKKIGEAWVMGRNPSLSTLEKDPPYKSCLQALVTIGVFLYFYFARGLLAKFTASTNG